MKLSVEQMCSDVEELRKHFISGSKKGIAEYQTAELICNELTDKMRALNALVEKKEIRINMLFNKIRRLENEKVSINECRGAESCPYRVLRSDHAGESEG